MQLIGGCAELAPLKLILALYTDVRHHHRYHLLVNIGCCHSICHHGFSWRIGGHAKKLHQAGSRGYRRSRERRRTTPNYSLKARSPGSNRRTASTYPLSNRPRRTRLYHRATAPFFHEIPRAAGPFKQTTKNDRLSYCFFFPVNRPFSLLRMPFFSSGWGWSGVCCC